MTPEKLPLRPPLLAARDPLQSRGIPRGPPPRGGGAGARGPAPPPGPADQGLARGHQHPRTEAKGRPKIGPSQCLDLGLAQGPGLSRPLPEEGRAARDQGPHPRDRSRLGPSPGPAAGPGQDQGAAAQSGPGDRGDPDRGARDRPGAGPDRGASDPDLDPGPGAGASCPDGAGAAAGASRGPVPGAGLDPALALAPDPARLTATSGTGRRSACETLSATAATRVAPAGAAAKRVTVMGPRRGGWWGLTTRTGKGVSLLLQGQKGRR